MRPVLAALKKYPRTSGSDLGGIRAFAPTSSSHKGQNGVLLVVGGSRKYHGAPLLAMSGASRFCDLIFFYSPSGKGEGGKNSNIEIANKIKPKLFEFIGIGKKEIERHVRWADCVLVGNGMENTQETRKLTTALLKKTKKYRKRLVLDAGALYPYVLPYLHPGVLLMPHSVEFERVFGIAVSAGAGNGGIEAGRRLARKHSCNILLKTPGFDCIFDFQGNVKLNFTGNPGMTKGGTGDVLAGLVAALACKTDLYSAACAAAYLNGLAGDMLAKIMGANFNASDLAGELPFALSCTMHGTRQAKD
ncbi:NAD(P)H-hydrate dehydratase [Candidatus Parvarchaeota archaeon]|nr:NAD(P)H-hydrate dehydratase [Candidatus Parvarchaeota archaeon]